MTAKHSPATSLPYEVESGKLYLPNTERIYATDPGPEGDFSIAFVRDVDDKTRKQNAAYIVHAANAYPRLIEAVREMAITRETKAFSSQTQLDGLNLRAQSLLRELGEAE